MKRLLLALGLVLGLVSPAVCGDIPLLFTGNAQSAGAIVSDGNGHMSISPGFGGSSGSQIAVAQVSTSGSDTKGVIGTGSTAAVPFATISGALTAGVAVSPLVIQIGVGAFVAPPDDFLNGGAGSLMRSNVAFIGAGRPFYNAGNTALAGGTIIQGEMMMGNRSNVTVMHLGVDDGSAVCTALYGGTGADCLGFYNTGSVVATPQTTGIIVDDVCCLGLSPSALFHALLVENTDRAQIRNVTMRYNTHGLICKATNSNFSDIISEGHNLDGMIIKGDNYAACSNVTVTGLVCGSVIPASYDGAGLEIQAESGGVEQNIVVRGYTAQHVSYGILMQQAGGGAVLKDIYLDAVVNDSNSYIATLAGAGVVVDIVGDTAAANGILTTADGTNSILLRSPYLTGTVNGIICSGGSLTAISPLTNVSTTAYSRTAGFFALVNPTFANAPTTKYSGTLQVNDLNTLTPANSWANVGAGNSTFRAVFNGSQVVMSGLISGGTQTSGTTLTTLPVGLRPLTTVTVMAIDNNAGTYTAIPITISTAGVVALGAAAPGNTSLSFDGVLFNAF